MNNSIVKLPSFAKVNWSLRVLGKRTDGYHEIQTVFQTVSLHDELTFGSRADGRILLSCSDPTIPADETNLVVRAAISLRERLQLPVGADISLLKRIPAKGGLGGASSNAAIALLGLNSVWQAGLSVSELVAIGSGLGADVPFFFVGGRAGGEGTGTTVTPLPDMPKQFLVLISPNASVATSAAYQALSAPSLTTNRSASILTSSFAEPVLGNCDQGPLHNDFEAVIFEIEPEIRRAKLALLEAGARGALLAGSGSSVFGIFETEEARLLALDRVRREPGWRVFSCDTISRERYRQALGSSGFLLLHFPDELSNTGA